MKLQGFDVILSNFQKKLRKWIELDWDFRRLFYKIKKNKKIEGFKVLCRIVLFLIFY